MPQNNKIILFSILCLISISILTGCQNNDLDEQINTNTNTQLIQTEQTPLLWGEDRVRLQESQTLVLNRHGCIWCWICTQVAPDNFTMNWRKAEVISQKNITSTQVNNAIENCPTSVIEIIEA